MKLYETMLTEYRNVYIRVKANSKEEAEKIYCEFARTDSDYLAEELKLNGGAEWENTEFEEVQPRLNDQCATITKNEDGTFDARYEDGIQ